MLHLSKLPFLKYMLFKKNQNKRNLFLYNELLPRFSFLDNHVPCYGVLVPMTVEIECVRQSGDPL